MIGSKVIAIIPARGGSKRIPNKNTKPFLGKPIIAYSINTAISSGLFDEVMVTTDNNEIAKIAKKFGANVPFMRSDKNSDDFAVIKDVVREVLLDYKKIGKEFDYVFCIFPTAPMITAEKLAKSLELLKNANVDVVLPVVRFSYPIQRSLIINKKGKLTMMWPDHARARSQDLTPTYHDAGQFFCAKVENILANSDIYAERTIPLVIPESEVQDIDNEEDWKLAEYKYQYINSQVLTSKQ